MSQKQYSKNNIPEIMSQKQYPKNNIPESISQKMTELNLSFIALILVFFIQIALLLFFIIILTI